MPDFSPADWPVWVNVLAFLAASVVVWIGAVRLTRALDAVAEKTGLGQAFVGMLLLGGITSLPEVANTLGSAAHGIPDMAANNLLGSAAINILLLAAADAAIGRKPLTAMVAQPATMMMCVLCSMALCLVAAAIAVGDIDVLGIGLWSPAICAFSVGAFYLASTYGPRAPWVVREILEEDENEAQDKPPQTSLRRLVVICVLAAVVIFVAGYSLSETGGALAAQTGLGTGFVGFLLIGLATSMPELSSIVTALKLKRYEMAFGQVIGTNFINLTLFLLADVAFRGGPVINELGAFEIVLALLGALLTGIFLVGLLERRDKVIFKMGYDSLAVIVLFVATSGLLYSLR